MEGILGDIGDEQGHKDVQGREDKVSVVDSCSLVILAHFSSQIGHHAFHFRKVGNKLDREIQSLSPVAWYQRKLIR